MSGTDLTILLAFAAGVISFLSPCVLPLVPAYVGQLTAIAVGGSAAGVPPSRWLAVRHSLAYVAGFGAVFTFLGVMATFVAGPLVDYLPALRTIGGVILIVLGLDLAGILHIPALERTWRPLDAGAAGSLATATGSTAFGSGGAGPSVGDRIGGHVVSSRGGWLASFGLGAIFAIGWTPCIGIILGGILTLAATSGTMAQGAVLLVAYTLGLGLPFILIAAGLRPRAARDGAARPPRPGRVADRRPAGRRHRRRDGLRLAGDPASLLQLQHGDLSVRPARVQPPPRTPRVDRAVQRAPARAGLRGRLRRGDRARRRDDAARQHRRPDPGTVDPRATAYIISSPPPIGLKVGATAPEFAGTNGDGTTYGLTDLDGKPIRLADLRGKAVWINFWTTWCPPCQSEVPILRKVSERVQGPRPRARRDQRAGDLARRRGRLRGALPAPRTRSASTATARSSGPTRPTACRPRCSSTPTGSSDRGAP